MKKVMIPLFGSLLVLSGCVNNESIYNPRYNRDYIYAVGYYGYQPQWATQYYSGVPVRGCRFGYCNAYPPGWSMRNW